MGPLSHSPPPLAMVWYSSHGASNLPCAYFPERAGSGWLSHRLHTRNNRAERQSAEERERNIQRYTPRVSFIRKDRASSRPDRLCGGHFRGGGTCAPPLIEIEIGPYRGPPVNAISTGVCIGGRANAVSPAHASRNNPFSQRRREREERGGVPLSNDRVARFPPRSRSFDCLECQARGLACNYCCCCCFQTYARKRLCSFFVCCRGHPPRRSRTLARVATRTRVAPEAGAHLDPSAHRRQLVWTPRILVSDSFFSFYLEW